MKHAAAGSGSRVSWTDAAAELGARLGLAGCGAFAALAWTALLLAELGGFRLWPCLAVFVVVLVVVFRLSRDRDAVPGGGGAWVMGLVVLLAGGSLFLTLPPSEMILGGWDPGVYLHTAAGIARHGTLRLPAEDLARLPPESVGLLTRNLHGIVEPFPGMRLLPDGALSPQFFHLYPSVLAVLYAVGGVPAALMLNPLLNAACIMAVAALAGRILGRRWAVLAALLLGLNPGQIWQARFCTSEMMTQFLVLTGFYFLLTAMTRDRPSIPAALAAGALFGLALLTRYSALLLTVPLAMILAWELFRPVKRKEAAFALMAFLALAGHAIAHVVWVAPFYKPLSSLVMLALAVALVLIPVGGWVGRSRWLADELARRPGIWRGVLAAAVLAWVGYAWFVRPWVWGGFSDLYWLGRLVARFDLVGLVEHVTMAEAFNMPCVAGIVGSAGLALAVLGWAGLIARSDWPVIRLWLAPSLLVFLVLVTSAFHDHFLPWMARRFVPVVFPLLALSAAAGVRLVWKAGERVRPRVGAVGAGIVVVAILALNIRPVVAASGIRDWPGLWSWQVRLAAHIPRGSIVYSDQPGFAAPLRFFFDRQAYELAGASPERRLAMWELALKEAERGRDVYVLTAHPAPERPGGSVQPAGAFPLDSSILNQTRVVFPLTSRKRGADFKLFRIGVDPADLSPAEMLLQE